MKDCTSCLLPKPDDQFSWNTGRCHSCRARANANNVADHRQKTAEIEANRSFNGYMQQWRIPA